MTLTVNDLYSVNMEWRPVGYESIGYLKDIPTFKKWLTKREKYKDTCYYDVKLHIQSIFSLISLHSGIPIDEIVSFYIERYPVLNEYFTDKKISFFTLLYWYNGIQPISPLEIDEIDNTFRVPDIDGYIKKMEQKSPESQKKEDFLCIWNECTPFQQKLLLCLIAGTLGAGNKNTVKKEWQQMIREDEANCINNMFDEVRESVKPVKQEVIKESSQILMWIRKGIISEKLLYEIIEHIERDYNKDKEEKRRQILAKPIDSSFEKIILILKIILNLQEKYNIQENINQLKSERDNAEKAHNNYFARLKEMSLSNSLNGNPTTPILIEAHDDRGNRGNLEEPEYGD